jgi:hypothetical protein
MRKHVALAVCTGIVVLAAFMRYRDVWSWYWAAENVATTWLFTGIWFGRVNLGRSHAQLVKGELRNANQWAIDSAAHLGRVLDQHSRHRFALRNDLEG